MLMGTSSQEMTPKKKSKAFQLSSLTVAAKKKKKKKNDRKCACNTVSLPLPNKATAFRS
jgi:hypothetical protein